MSLRDHLGAERVDCLCRPSEKRTKVGISLSGEIGLSRRYKQFLPVFFFWLQVCHRLTKGV